MGLGKFMHVHWLRWTYIPVPSKIKYLVTLKCNLPTTIKPSCSPHTLSAIQCSTLYNLSSTFTTLLDLNFKNRPLNSSEQFSIYIRLHLSSAENSEGNHRFSFETLYHLGFWTLSSRCLVFSLWLLSSYISSSFDPKLDIIPFLS